PGDVLALTCVYPSQLVEFGNLSRNLHGQIRNVIPGDAFNAAGAREDSSAKCFLADSIRADYAHPGDDYARCHEIVRCADTNGSCKWVLGPWALVVGRNI